MDADNKSNTDQKDPTNASNKNEAEAGKKTDKDNVEKVEEGTKSTQPSILVNGTALNGQVQSENVVEDPNASKMVDLLDKQNTPNSEEKHEIEHEWTFWYVYTLSHNEKKKQGKRGRHHDYILHEVYSFNTVEDFWRMYNNIYTVEEIMPNTDYMLFRKGIRPEWEDISNREGGKWVVTLPIEEDMEEECGLAWLKSLTTLISGQIEMEEQDKINGIVLSVREKHLRLSLWCQESKNIEVLMKIGRRLKNWCGFHDKFKFKFMLHEKALKHDLDNAAYVDI